MRGRSVADQESHKLREVGSIPTPATNSECDHIVLVDTQGNKCRIEQLMEYIGTEESMRSLLDGRKSSAYKCKFCPDCGEKINWYKLKRTVLSLVALRPKSEKIKFEVKYITTWNSLIPGKGNTWTLTSPYEGDK